MSLLLPLNGVTEMVRPRARIGRLFVSPPSTNFCHRHIDTKLWSERLKDLGLLVLINLRILTKNTAHLEQMFAQMFLHASNPSGLSLPQF